MEVFGVVASAIALMKCVECGAIMNQGERERNPSVEENGIYRPIHQACLDKRQQQAKP